MIRFTKLKSTNRKDLKKILPLPKPFTVLIEPSSRCNFRCVQCFQSGKAASDFTRGRGDMPLPLFRKVLAQLKAWPGPKLKVLKLSLYGEPLLNPEFCEMLRLAGESGVAERIETTTNASLLSREVAEKLVKYGLDYARVSIYAPGQEKHRAVTGSPVKISTIHENLRVLREIRRSGGSEKPFISCKMLDSYGSDNEEFRRLYRDVADEAFLDKPHGWIKVDGADFIGDYYRSGSSAARKDLKEHSTRRVACPMAFTTMAVRSNGDVSPCCVDFIGGTTLANVKELRLREIWSSGLWYEFQKMQLEGRKQQNPSCSRCDFYLSGHYIKDNIDGFPVKKLLKPGCAGSRGKP